MSGVTQPRGSGPVPNPGTPVFPGAAAVLASLPPSAYYSDTMCQIAPVSRSRVAGTTPLVDAGGLETFIAKTRADAQTEAEAINRSAAQATSGNVVARGFNRVVNVFSHQQDHLESTRRTAVEALTARLPRDLETFHQLVDQAHGDPARLQAANDFLQGALANAQRSATAYQGQEVEMSRSNKFWSGIAADTVAGLGVVAGVALTATGVGAPAGAALIAGSFAGGGALSLGAHAALDNQFDLRKEGLATFVVGGISGVATALTAGASTAVAGRLSAGAARVVGQNAAQGVVMRGATMAVARGITNAAIGASVNGVQAIAQESQTGWQAGSGQRIAGAVGLGAAGGFVGGALWSGVSSVLGGLGGAIGSRLPASLTAQTARLSQAANTRIGQVVTNAAAGAFYGGPVGAAGTWLTAKMTGQPMSRDDFWQQAVGGAIQGGLVYGAWAGTPAGSRDLEAAGSNAVAVPGRRTPKFDRMQRSRVRLDRTMQRLSRTLTPGQPLPGLRPMRLSRTQRAAAGQGVRDQGG